MPDLTNGNANGSSNNDKTSGTFSFQSQGNATSPVPVPTAPFETISYQAPAGVTAPPEPEKTVISSGEDIKLGQKETPTEIPKEVPTEVPTEIPTGVPQQGSFLERYKTVETAEEKSVPPEPQKLEEIFSPSGQPPPETKPPAPSEKEYKMPELPKSSIFSKLLPIALFLLIIALAIFVGMKFLPGLRGAKQVELTWWGLWEDEKTMQPIIDAYKKEQPNITVHYVKKNPKEYRALLQSSIARDIGPDIFRFHNTWLPMLKVELGAMPEKLKSQINFSTTFYPTAYYDLVQNNQIFGFPLMFDGLALYSNTDMLQAAGLKAPTGWSETADSAKKLTVRDEAGNLKISGLALGNTSVDHWSDILGLMFLQNGADPALPTDSCAKEAFDYYVSFTSDKDGTWNDTIGSSTLAFASAKEAMYIGPSWEAFEIKKMNPSLNFTISPFPQVAGGSRYWATYWAEGVSSKSKNGDAAWNFLMFLTKKETLQQIYSDQTKSSKERLFGEIYPRVDMASLVKNDPLVGPYISGAPQAKSWYLASRTYDDGINDRIIKYYEDAVNSVVKKEQTSTEALKTAASGVAQVLKDYGLTPPTTNKNCQETTP